MNIVDELLGFFTRIFRSKVNSLESQAKAKVTNAQYRAQSKVTNALNRQLDAGIDKARASVTGTPKKG